jgi:protein SCO1/2
MNRRPLFPRALYRISLCVLLAVVMGLSACSNNQAEKQRQQSKGKNSEEHRYDFKGNVVAVDRARGEVTVEHEDIVGYMPAMTMSFPLRDADALKTVEAGDHIQATLVVTDEAFWLEQPIITKAQPGGSASASTDGSAATRPAGPTEPQPGAEVPDVKLVNQDGRAFSTRQFKGRALVINFIYTRCPLPDYCPLMSANFAQINGALNDDPETRKRARLLSVTLDPEFDRPEVLRSYGAAYAGGKFDNWDFATGDPAEIRRLAEFFGLMYKAEGGQVIHSLRTAVITPEGKLYKVYRGNEWKPAEVLSDLKVALSQG